MLSSPAAQHSRMPSSFTSRRRNQLALIFCALIFVVIGIGIFIGARRSLADAALVSHTHEVIGRVDEIQARVLDAESAQRGFLLTGNDAYLLDYQTSVQRLPILLDNPRRLIVDNPAQEQHLTQLQRLVETRLQQIQHVLDVYAQGGLEQARADIRQSAFRTVSAIREQALVTASIGVASFPADGEQGASLIQKADAALYRAKHRGRNRVERYGAVVDAVD